MWLGNPEKIAAAHYLQVTEADFLPAADTVRGRRVVGGRDLDTSIPRSCSSCFLNIETFQEVGVIVENARIPAKYCLHHAA